MDEALKIFSCKAFGGEYLADFFATKAICRCSMSNTRLYSSHSTFVPL